MSNRTFNTLWDKANQQLIAHVDYELPKDKVLQPTDRESSFQHLAVLYVKYLGVFRNLEQSYDQMLHPQKRRLLREAVVACMGRMLEIKHKMVEIEASDFHNFSDILLDLKLSPDALAVPVPRFFVEERKTQLAMKYAVLEQFCAKTVGGSESLVNFPALNISEAVRIIQINERGRQGKLRAHYMRALKAQAEKERDMDGTQEEMDVGDAAIRIQRAWRGYTARKLCKKLLNDENVFLHMKRVTPAQDARPNAVSKMEATKTYRKSLQGLHEEEYQQALVATKEKIAKVEGPDMRESMQDSFRQWYMEHKRVSGKFPEFPDDTIWQHPTFKFGAEPRKSLTSDGDTTAPTKKASKDNIKTPDDKKKKPKTSEEEIDENKFKFDGSKYIDTIKKGHDSYAQTWEKKEERENFAQKHDQDIIKNDKRKEVEAEIKMEVFEVLKEELRSLKAAVDKDGKGKKGKGAKAGGKKKGGKGKKGKGGKGKKGKKEKDITANRTMESLVEELIQTGILQKPQNARMNDFKGNFNIMANSQSKTLVEPTLFELQRVVSEYCVLPMGYNPADEKDTIPGITSMLLYGAKGSGKTMLVNAIANEIGAWVFNLTPKNTAGLFVGKSNVTKMVHMAYKVAKAHAPAIIYIDNVEMIFAKKVPKDDTSDPKRLKKDILKFAKGVGVSDHVILIGTSNKPWDADVKAMLPLFQKNLYCSKPDYSSRYTLWSHFITLRAGHVGKNIGFGLLSRLSNGLSAGQIYSVCLRVLTDRRVRLLPTRIMGTEEFIIELFSEGPIDTASEDDMFKDFTGKLPLQKKRMNLFSDDGETGTDVKAKKDTKKKK